nr:uncharacterized protein LOC111833951 isoform X5 [Paramormyrops kingsleyae]
MGYSCCVKGCHTKSQGRKVDHNIRFFRIPTWKRGYVRQVEKGPWRRDWPNNTAFLIIHPIRGASRSHGRRLVLHTDWPSPTMAPKCPASSKPSGSSEPNRQRKTLTIQEKVKLLDILRTRMKMKTRMRNLGSFRREQGESPGLTRSNRDIDRPDSGGLSGHVTHSRFCLRIGPP